MIAEALNSLFTGAATSVDPVHPKDPQLARMFGVGSGTLSGVAVDEQKVLALPAVIRAINIISNGVGRLPYYVYKNHDEGKEPDRSHVSWTAVNRKPHREITAGHFRRTMTSWALSYGNAVAYIDRPNWPNGPIELIPLLPDRTFPFRARGSTADPNLEHDGTLMFGTTIGGRKFSFLAEDCLHIRGLGPNPWWGWNVVDILAETFGGALATQQFGHRFFGQGANPSGFVEMAGGLDEVAQKNFRESMQLVTGGLSNAHKIAVLEEGAKFHQWTISPEQAQFLQTKEFDVRQLAMALGIKVHKLIDSANSSYNSLEQANQEHKDDDLMPWIDAWQDEYEDKMLTEEEKESGSHCILADDQRLEWVSFVHRSDGAAKLLNNGIADQDEARDIVGLAPSGSSKSKKFRIPRNIGFEDEGEDVVTADTSQESTQPPSESTRSLAKTVLAGFVRLYSNQANSRVNKGAKEFMAWLDDFDPDRHGDEAIRAEITELAAEMRAALDECTQCATTHDELKRLVGVTSQDFTSLIDKYADKAAERLSK